MEIDAEKFCVVESVDCRGARVWLEIGTLEVAAH
jgi:hypothetical protein